MSFFFKKHLTNALKNIRTLDVRRIDWINIGRWPFVFHLTSCLILFIALTLFSYLNLLKPTYQRLQTEIKQETDLKKTLSDQLSLIVHRDYYTKQIALLKANKETEEPLTSLDIPTALETLSQTAKSTHLQIEKLSPLTYQTDEHLLFQIIGNGSYHAIALFCSALQTLPFPVSIRTLSINRIKKQLHMNLNIRIHIVAPDTVVHKTAS